MEHHDLDYVKRLIERYHIADSDELRSAVADMIVRQMLCEQWLSELRCLRERTLSPCPDPHGHTHAPC